MKNFNTLFIKPRYSNVIGTCFFNQSCINARNEANAQALAAQEQQQQLLLAIANQPVGGLKTGAMIAIFATLIIGGVVIIILKRKKTI